MDTITVSVLRGPQQKFAGFGTSLINSGGDYQKLTPSEQKALSSKLWRDLKFHHLRFWFNVDRFASEPGKRDWSEFRRWYVDSGLIRDAKKAGVSTLLLAPDGAPPYLTEKSPQGSSQTGLKLKNGAEPEYAHIVADFIVLLRRETGIEINVTGIQNEPNDLERFAPDQMVRVVKLLRNELNRRGLNRVQIIAPETASADDSLYAALDALQADGKAWRSLSGVASHTYNMGATSKAQQKASGKDYWMTEASDNGPEAPGDTKRAASLASRVLSDLNNGVTHWLHFIGFEVPDPKDDATRIMKYTTNPLKITPFQKYYSYQQLAQTFDVNGTLRRCVSQTEGEMTWTYGKKPRVTVACIRNQNGSWGLGVSNYTSPTFRDENNTGKWDIDQEGYAARPFIVVLRIEELAGQAAVPFSVTRSQTGGPPKQEPPVIFRGGEASLLVRPLELVTLRSGAVK